MCGTNCKCLSCQNFPDSEALKIVRTIQDGTNVPPGTLKQLKETSKLLKAVSSPSITSNALSSTTSSSSSSSSSSTTSGVNAVGDVDSDESSCSGSSSTSDSREGSPTLGDKVHCDLNESQSAQTTPSDGERRVYDEQDSESRRRKRKFSSSSSPSPFKQISYLSTDGMNDDMQSSSSSLSAQSSSSSSSSSFNGAERRETSKKSSSTRKSGRSTAPATSRPIKPSSLPLQQQQQQQQQQQAVPFKKRKINESIITYPFFGINQPSAPKIVALRCLEYLDGPSLYNMSVVNTLWSKAAMDEALWE